MGPKYILGAQVLGAQTVLLVNLRALDVLGPLLGRRVDKAHDTVVQVETINLLGSERLHEHLDGLPGAAESTLALAAVRAAFAAVVDDPRPHLVVVVEQEVAPVPARAAP